VTQCERSEHILCPELALGYNTVYSMSFEFPHIKRDRTPKPPASAGDEVKPTPAVEKKQRADKRGKQQRREGETEQREHKQC